MVLAFRDVVNTLTYTRVHLFLPALPARPTQHQTPALTEAELLYQTHGSLCFVQFCSSPCAPLTICHPGRDRQCPLLIQAHPLKSLFPALNHLSRPNCHTVSRVTMSSIYMYTYVSMVEHRARDCQNNPLLCTRRRTTNVLPRVKHTAVGE